MQTQMDTKTGRMHKLELKIRDLEGKIMENKEAEKKRERKAKD